MMWLIFWVLLSVAVALFAGYRGRSALGWFVLSLLISPLLGFIFVAVVPNLAKEPNEQTHRKCPDCAEQVLREARVCKHCGAKLVALVASAPAAPAMSAEAAERAARITRASVVFWSLVGVAVALVFLAALLR